MHLCVVHACTLHNALHACACPVHHVCTVHHACTVFHACTFHHASTMHACTMHPDALCMHAQCMHVQCIMHLYFVVLIKVFKFIWTFEHLSCFFIFKLFSVLIKIEFKLYKMSSSHYCDLQCQDQTSRSRCELEFISVFWPYINDG